MVPCRLSFALGLALFAAPAFAEDPAGGDPPPALPPLVVEEPRFVPEREESNEEARERLDRAPSNTGLVTEERIRETRAFDLEDALEYVPGVLVRSRGVGEEPQLSIRGSGLRNNFHTRGVNVLIDGFPFQNADGFSDVESFELLALRRIEVYKGADALRYGANALGGAINLVTRTGRDAPRFEGRTEVGSYGYWKTFVASGMEEGANDVYAAVSHTQRQGYRANTDQNRQRLYANAAHRFAGGASLRADLGYTHSKADLAGALTRAEFHRDPRQSDPAYVRQRAARDYDYTRGALTLAVPLGETEALTLAGQLNYQDLDHPLPFSIIDNVTWNGTTELRLVSTRPLGGLDSRATLGVQLAGTRQPEKFWNNLGGHRGALNKHTINKAANVAGFVQDDLALTEALHLVAGVRYQWAWRAVEDRLKTEPGGGLDRRADDSGRATFSLVSPSIGVVYDVAPDVQVFGSAGLAQEAPLLLELTAPGAIDGTLDELDAQRAWQFELGTRGRIGERVTWEAALYDWELRDELRNENVRPFPGAPFTLGRYVNVDRSRHLGFELGGAVRVAQDVVAALGGAGTDTLDLRAVYGYGHFTFADDPVFGDNDLPGAPQHDLRAELRYAHGAGFWIAPSVEWTPDGAYVDSANTSRAPGYALYHLRAGYDHEPSGLGAFFEVRNLTDREHVSSVVVDAADGRSFEPGDGRAFYGGVRWTWR
jgi:iron complex outermembrane receptor protein